MTVSITSSTIVESLWGPEEVTAIPLHSSGEFLSLSLTSTSSVGKNTVTSVAFHPVDETCFVLGTEAGRAYGVSLQENKLFLLADVGDRSALRCATFCPGYLTSPIVVFACGDNRLLFLDWKRGIMLQDVTAAEHQRPILHILTGASTESLFCTLSADAISCWEPIEDSGIAYTSAPLSSTSPGTSHKGWFCPKGAPVHSPNDRGVSGFSMPRYGCSATALPTQCTLQLQGKSSRNLKHAMSVMHRFLGVHILHPALLLSVETGGVLSLWSRGAVLENGDRAACPASLHLLKSATTPSLLRVRSSVQCGSLIALGGDAATADGQPGQLVPVVAFIVGQTLEGSGMVRLPVRSSAGSTKDRAVTVRQLRALQSDCVACLLSTGVVHVVLPSTFHLVFSIRPPSVGAAAHCFSSRSSWNFTPSGPTLGAMWREHLLYLLHLPTARRGDVGTVVVFEPALLRVGSKQVSLTGLVGDKERVSSVSKASQPDISLDDAPVATGDTVVTAKSFLRPSKTAQITSSLLVKTADGEHSGVDAALAVLSFCRPQVVIPEKGLPQIWADVNEVDLHFLNTGSTEPRLAHRGERDARTTAAVPLTWSSPAAFCDTLCAFSCQYNLNQLQAHLLKHGVYPHQYRAEVWRFLVGLPNKAKTAPQFAALARRPVHLGVSQLMTPFPLPPSSTRDAVEMALSCLCWASPVLTLASYLPVLAYPLSMIFQDDVQSVVEVVLVFFLNWGKDFFLCHPHGPATLLMAMERQLRRLDGQLCQHLDAIGAGVAVWGWELLTTFFTDCLTGPEWVQLMDHTLTASPLWLFAFHINLLRIRLRSELLSALSVDQVRCILRCIPTTTALSPTSSPKKSLQRLIEETYRLHHSWTCETDDSPVSLSALKVFRTISSNFVYPSNFAHDTVVLAQKLHQLSVLQGIREEEKKSAAHLDQLRKTAEVTSTEEAAFLQQQRARMAAKYDASAAAWQAHVALERSRQERDAKERQLRWDALQTRTCSAEEMKALRAEMSMVESQLRHDVVDRHMEELKWRLSAHLSDDELLRLQKGADEQVEDAVHRIEEDQRRYEEDAVEYRAAPVLVTEGLSLKKDGVLEEEAAANIFDSQTSHPVTPLQPTAIPSSHVSGRAEEEARRESKAVGPTEEEGMEWEEKLDASEDNTELDQNRKRVVHSDGRPSCSSSADSCRGVSSVLKTRTGKDDDDGGRPLHHRDDRALLSKDAPLNAQTPVDCSHHNAEVCHEPGTNFKKATAQCVVDEQRPKRRCATLPRHDHRDVFDGNCKVAQSQQRFLELRNRVLGRTDPGFRQEASVDPLRRYRPPYRGDGSTTMTATPSTQSSSRLSPSSRQRLFDQYDPNRSSSRTRRWTCDFHRSRQSHLPYHPSSATTCTRTADTATPEESVSATTISTSYESPSMCSCPDYDYSTGTSVAYRTGESKSTVSPTSLSSSTCTDRTRCNTNRLV